MTITALLALLDEEQPWVRRHPAPWIPHTADKRKQPTVQYRTTDPPTPQDEQTASLSQLLAWAESHENKAVRAQAEKVATGIKALRDRWQTDQELTAVTTEEQKLEKRLAELRARKAELSPTRPGKARDHNPAEVRSWARANNVEVPALGRVPKAVVDAWRQRDNA